jgi:hypothetical protein
MKRKKIEKKLALNKTTVSDLNAQELKGINGGGTLEDCTLRVCSFFFCTASPLCTREYDCTESPNC